ncbi:MAG: RHS repeat-associated core domain-containing protein, partial [Chloroflexi bacterium]|nr:RHS repeat-associated core domain-containing protein [Chloroflexota bacterium]
GTLSTDRKFTGQRLDATTGLYFYNARYYDAGVGRFASADSVVQAPQNPQSANRYSYVVNNPLRYTDPTGRCWGRYENAPGCETARKVARATGQLVTNVGEAVATGNRVASEVQTAEAQGYVEVGGALIQAAVPENGVQGITIAVSVSVPVFIEGQVALLVDSRGQFAIAPSLTTGGSSAIGFSVTPGVVKSNVPEVELMGGKSASVGFSGSLFFRTVGEDLVLVQLPDGTVAFSTTTVVGIGQTIPIPEVHTGATYTWIVLIGDKSTLTGGYDPD